MTLPPTSATTALLGNGYQLPDWDPDPDLSAYVNKNAPKPVAEQVAVTPPQNNTAVILPTYQHPEFTKTASERPIAAPLDAVGTAIVSGAANGHSSAIPIANKPDINAAITFLQSYRVHLWCLTAIVPDSDDTLISTQTFGPGRPETTSWLRKYEGNRNLYYSINEPRGPRHKKCKKTDIRKVHFLHADFDPLSDETPAECKARVLALLAKSPIPPTYIIDSGNGIQALWQLADPIELPSPDSAQFDKAVDDIEGHNRWLAEELGADTSAWNIDRVFRLPGTTNLPTKAKLAKGRSPCVARLIEATGAIYSLDQFDWIPAAAGASNGELRKIEVGDLPEVNLNDLPLSRRIKEVIVTGNDSQTPYPSRSHAVFGVCCAMLRAKCNPATILAVLANPNHQIGEHIVAQKSRNPRDYALRQIARAELVVAAEPQQAPKEKATQPDQTHTEPGKENNERVVIRLVKGELPRVVDEIETTLIDHGVPIFSRGDRLMRPVVETVPAAKGRKTTVARLKELKEEFALDLFAKAATFQRYDGRSKDWVNVDPPKQAAATLLARDGLWRFPLIAGVITVPTLRPDGSLLVDAGYDAKTRLYLEIDPQLQLPPMPPTPSRADAEAALKLLLSLLPEFPFVDPKVDRAVTLSGIITTVIRAALPVVPLHAIQTHSPGTGKSYLVDLISVITTGRWCPVIAAGKTEDETEKRLGALLLNGSTIISIDNVSADLGGDVLCQITERPLVRVRILGRSEAPVMECKAMIFVTGNNLVLRGDLSRRTVRCSLDAKVERPELRDFNFDPIAAVLQNRGAYVAAVLTIVQAYMAAGSPKVCGKLGSYEEWSAMVRAPLIWLGEADPVDSMESVRQDDPELSAICELFAHWIEHLQLIEGYPANDIIKTACDRSQSFHPDVPGEFKHPEFRDLLLRQAGEGGFVSPKRLGKWLSRISGRVVSVEKDPYRLLSTPVGHMLRFGLEKVKS